MSLLDTASLVITPNGTKAGTLYSVVPSSGAGDMTVTRATTATRVNSAGLIESVASNVPRLDYSNGTCPSILVEPQRTNTLLYSEDLSNSNWVNYGSSKISNATTSPDGNNTADKLEENSATDIHLIVQGTKWDTTQRTASLYVKSAERTKVYIANGSLGEGSFFNLSNGTVEGNIGSFTGTIKSVGNGWYRVTATHTGSGSQTFAIGIYTNFTGNYITTTEYLGTAGSGLYLWGAQVEAGSYATSYIPTTSASVTRNADVINKTGISSLIGQTEGTMFLDFVFKTPPLDICGPIGISSADNSNRIGFWNNYTFNSIAIFLRANGSNLFNTSVSSLVDGTRYKLAVSYKSGDIRVYLNGTLTNTFTNTFTFSNDISVLYNASYESTSNVHQRTNQITLWKTALTNTQLAQLTTI